VYRLYLKNRACRIGGFGGDGSADGLTIALYEYTLVV